MDARPTQSGESAGTGDGKQASEASALHGCVLLPLNGALAARPRLNHVTLRDVRDGRNSDKTGAA
jgi:hypothetical protein